MKKSKKLTTKDLFEYLDVYTFVDDSEVTMAVNDFFRDYIEKDDNFQASYGELIYFQELADDYIKDRKLTFTN